MAKDARKSPAKAAPEEPAHGYEFSGPPGALAISFGLPLVCYLAAFLCNDITGCPVPSTLSPSTFTLAKLKEETGWSPNGIMGLVNWKATVGVLSYYLLSLTLWRFLPGEEVEGTVLRSGGKLKYKFNTFVSTLFMLGGVTVGTAIYGANFLLWTFIWDNYVQIMTVNLGISFLLATFVYMRSFSVKAGNAEHRELAAGGHSGNIMYDWFIGRELNPRITLPVFGTVDIKTWCELRPGMFSWMLLDFSFMAHQYQLYGFISDSMIVVVAFQVLYILDAYYMESSMLTMIDITTDGFGFMLSFGDLVWLPFIYSLQARYLAVYPLHLGLSGIAGVFAVQAFGYYIFRASNNEKNRFRTDPKDPSIQHLTYMKTASGSKLLTSGWWGRSRHPNYLGDWIMAWSYSVPTGVAGYLIQHQGTTPPLSSQSLPEDGFFIGAPVSAQVVQGDARGWGMLITYFYVLYFAVLLIHRERRDEEKCKKKYGKDWDEYKRIVPWKIVPYVY